jgi:hypothetical protein
MNCMRRMAISSGRQSETIFLRRFKFKLKTISLNPVPALTEQVAKSFHEKAGSCQDGFSFLIRGFFV